MANATLVSFDIEVGDLVVAALDSSGLRPNVAMWAILGEYGDARIVLASRKFNQESSAGAYEQILPALRKAGINPLRLPSLLVLPMKDQGIKDLRKSFSKFGDARGIRIAPRSFGSRFLEDCFVYRIE
jgi:hypothetical protein